MLSKNIRQNLIIKTLLFVVAWLLTSSLLTISSNSSLRQGTFGNHLAQEGQSTHLQNIDDTLSLSSPMDPPVPLSNGWNNSYGTFNRALDQNGNPNRMYHTGLDIGGDEKSTVVRAADTGMVRFIVGLAGPVSTPEKMATWSDNNNDQKVDPNEIRDPFPTNRTTSNHGLGIAIIIEHSSNLYTLYGHLHAIKAEIYDAVRDGGSFQGSFPIEKGKPIAVLGRSRYQNWSDPSFGPHVHFEVKTRLSLESPRGDDNNTYFYWGYTPDLPTPYGYHDPFLCFYPPPAPTPSMALIKVINEETGTPGTLADQCNSTDANRGIRVYSGPGTNYSVLGWTGLNQVFTTDATVISTLSGDSIPRLWYRIHLPNRLGPAPSYGWIASQRRDGTPLIEEVSTAVIVEVINDDGQGWRLRRDPAVDCNLTPANCVQVWDNLRNTTPRSILTWNGSRFIRFATQNVDGKIWHEIYLPKFYFQYPQSTTKCGPSQDNVVGEVDKVWLRDDAVRIITDGSTISPPAVSTNPATAITITSAALNGQVNPNGAATTAYFEFGTDSTLANHSATSQQQIPAGTLSVPVNATLTGLSPNTTYYFRLVGINSGGTNKSSPIRSFTTQLIDDNTGPTLTITSHRQGQPVTTRTITLSGSATDANRGNNGISSVTVNGVRATGDTASGSGTANWRRAITLSPGPNPITVIAMDNSPNRNATTQTIMVIYCPYSISPTSQLFGKDGGNGSVAVTAPGGCSWTARSTGWVTITSGASGSGNGTVTYSVQANTTTSFRSRTMTIAGRSFSVRQAGVCRVTPITIGRTISTSLSTSDCWSPGRTGPSGPFYADRYSFSATAGQQVAILLTSTAFDTYLYLIGPNGVIIAQDNNGGGGTNSRIPPGSGLFPLPSNGTYIIEVTSSIAGKTGSYKLSLTR